MGYSGAAWPEMAEDTGGRMIDVHNEKSLEKAFDEISEELRSQYVLGYYPTNTKRDGTFRKIKVEVTRPIRRYWPARATTRRSSTASAVLSTPSSAALMTMHQKIHGVDRLILMPAVPRGLRNIPCACARSDPSIGLHVNFAIFARRLRIRRRIGNEVLAAQFRSDVEERCARSSTL